jgi:heme o synthase
MKRFSAFTDLIKYKLSLAVVLSSITGYFISCNVVWPRLLFLSAGVFFLASASAGLNQYSERTTDSLMERTKNRPIPSGRMSETDVLTISSMLFIIGVLFLFQNGFIPLFLGLLTVFLYNFVYTRLKRITVLSIIPGGLVGAIPPMIGYSSAGGILSNPDILSFSAFMFLWQVPHFWLIIARYGEEYQKAGIANISAYLSEKQIKNLVFFWVFVSSILLMVFFLVTHLFGNPFLILFSLLNITFIFLFYRKLFGTVKLEEINGAMIIINSYGLLIMLLIIAISISRF